jgi:nucleotide-binding universal stress UspA family protein
VRVVAAIEDEAFGSAIINFLISHKWSPGTAFLLLHVTEPASIGDDVTMIYGDENSREIDLDCNQFRSKLLDDYKEKLTRRFGDSASVEIELLVGRPDQEIVENANRWNADMVVMGSHGRQGVSRFILGSVSLFVASHANCSVVILHPSSLSLVDQEQSDANKLVNAGADASPNTSDRAYRKHAV